MGGAAFATLYENGVPINIPRLPNLLYWNALSHVHGKLASLYDRVITPLPAPEKLDHGDLDVLMGSPVISKPWPTAQHVAELLDATHQQADGSGTWTFAVKLHQLISPAVEFKELGLLEFQDAYVQIDIHVCGSDENVGWRYFKHGYGDLWQILGVIVRPFGLIADENALCLRLLEVEQGMGSKDAAKIRLTDSPQETMKFLGLSADWYKRGFQTREELFNFATSCRLFTTTSFVKSSPAHQDKRGDDSANIGKGDRHRKKTRMMFRDFIDWLDQNHEDLMCFNTTLTREDIYNESVTRYGKKEEISKVLYNHRRIVAEARLRKRVAAAIPASYEGEARTTVMRGLRVHVRMDERRLPFVKRPSQDERAQKTEQSWIDCVLAEDELLKWLISRLPEIENLEIARREENERCRVSAEAKSGEMRR